MFEVTAHWINKKFNMKKYILVLKKIEGPHTGSNFASLIHHTINQCNIPDWLYCITANDASNNTTMAAHGSSTQPDYSL